MMDYTCDRDGCENKRINGSGVRKTESGDWRHEASVPPAAPNTMRVCRSCLKELVKR